MERIMVQNNQTAEYLYLEDHQTENFYNLGYRMVPESLRQQPDITNSQCLLLSILFIEKNQGLTNKQLAQRYDPSKNTSPQVPKIFIRKLVKSGYVTIAGKGKARRAIPTLKARQYTVGKQKYLIIHADIMMAPISGTRKMLHALKRALEKGRQEKVQQGKYVPMAGPQFLAKSLGLKRSTIYYHEEKIRRATVTPISQLDMFLDSTRYVFRPYNIVDNKYITNNILIIYKKHTNKLVCRDFVDEVPLIANSYFSPTEDYNMPIPSPKPFDYSTLQSRSITPKKPIKVNPDLLAELQSITLAHITKHQEGKMACAASCRVIGGLKRGLYTILDDGAVKCITKDLARYGVTPEQVTELLHKKWSPEERQMLYQNLNNHYSEAYGYFGKIKKIDLATALFHPRQTYSPLLTAYFRPRVLQEKKKPTPVKPPVELETLSNTILKACDEKAPTFKFIGMLHDIREYFNENVLERQNVIKLDVYTWFTWYTEMVQFISGEFNNSPKWPFFKPGSVPFGEWEKYYKKKIRQEVEATLWSREMHKSENTSKIQEYQRYLEGEGIFVSYEKAVEMYNS
jgi:hypothetical protein